MRNNEQYICRSCGSNLYFDPHQATLKCEHCGDHVEISYPLDAWKVKLHPHEDGARRFSENDFELTHSAHCDVCGATITFYRDYMAQNCPYCSSAIIANLKDKQPLIPDGIVLFEIDEKTARKKIDDWLDFGSLLMPKIRKTSKQSKSLAKVYLPYWNFHVDSTTSYFGARGRANSEGHVTSWRPASGVVEYSTQSAFVCATKHLNPNTSNQLLPREISNIIGYKPEFLAGFLTESCSVSFEEANNSARQMINTRIQGEIRSEIGGDAQRVYTKNTIYSPQNYQLILLPAYEMSYVHRGEKYSVMVNGQTGEVVGNRPDNTKRVSIIAAIIFIAFMALFYFDTLLKS